MAETDNLLSRIDAEFTAMEDKVKQFQPRQRQWLRRTDPQRK